jgi:hypothetical protein
LSTATLAVGEQRGRAGAATAIGVTRQRMLAESALLQRLGRSHQRDPGCDYEPDTGSRADFCLVAEAKARRDHRPKKKGVVGLLDRWRVLLFESRSPLRPLPGFRESSGCICTIGFWTAPGLDDTSWLLWLMLYQRACSLTTERRGHPWPLVP